jgi:hypothetical protein
VWVLKGTTVISEFVVKQYQRNLKWLLKKEAILP